MFDYFNLDNYKKLNKKLPAGVNITNVTTISGEDDSFTIKLTFRIGLKRFKDELYYLKRPKSSTVFVDTLVALTYFLMET